jgi:Na+/H+ antiporter NhaC
MNGKLSALFGTLVGLGLAALLLVPTADRTTLVAQGVGDLLSDQREADGGIYAALEAVAGGETRVALAVTIDGALSDHDGFSRAFGSHLNLWNQRDDRPEDAPLLALVPAGTGGAMAVRLAVSDAEAGVSVLASVTGPGGSRTIQAGDALWVPPSRTALVPPLLAILVALLLRKTLLALFLGIFSGAVLMVMAREGDTLIEALPVGLMEVVTVYLHGELVDTFRVEIIGFVIALVAMVGVMSRSGGVQGLIELLVGFAKSVRSTLLVTWGMGLLIFFDDYANCLLVGNTMRPLTDRLRISREKLAYVVDSTAAPIAGISLLSTWIAFEVSTYSAHLPAAGISDNAYAVFLQTIPFRYYCLFTLMFVGVSIILGRDFGPMARAEARARTTGELVRKGGTPMVSDEATRIEPRDGMPRRWFDAALPIGLVLFATLTWIFFDGGGFSKSWSSEEGGLFTLEGVTGVLFDGSGGRPIFYGASAGLALAAFLAGSNALRLATLAGLLSAWFLDVHLEQWIVNLPFVLDGRDQGLLANFAPYLAYAATFGAGALVACFLPFAPINSTARPHLPIGDIRSAALSSVKALFFAVMILFQAWMIGKVCADLKTADYLVALLSGSVGPTMLPVLLFVAACMVAFATGSSWSTMSILLPNVVALAASVGDAAGMGALPMVVLCIGAVLEGSIFGDHCSPISDTTVLSSVSSASDHVDHVRTQAPYALVTASLAIVVGYIPTVAFDWWSTPMALGTGLVIIVGVLMFLGVRAPEPPRNDQGGGEPLVLKIQEPGQAS